jgi:hypothetical protein
VALASVLGGAFACSGSTSTGLRPTTGILIRAETLTTGRGCGREPTNLYKFAVVVFGYKSGDELDPASYQTPVTANVFDCFTDGAFIDLAPVQDNPRFRLEVYAYNEQSYTPARDVIESAGTNTTQLRATSPTWTTECTALQRRDVQTLALCSPLAPGLSGLGGVVATTRIALDTTSFRLADGRIATCGAAGDAGSSDAGGLELEAGPPDADVSDASDEAGADAPDAGDAGPVDAGAAVTFTTARVRWRSGAVVGPTIDVRCPAPYTADVAAGPARYQVDVGLLDESGAPIGQTVCSVTTQTGATSSAVCP